MSDNKTIYCEIIDHLGTLGEHKGWTRELNLVSWNGAPPKFDIRDWSDDHDRRSKGMTFTDYEMHEIVRMYLDAKNNQVWEKAKAKAAERKRKSEEYLAAQKGKEEEAARLEEANQAAFEGTLPPEEELSPEDYPLNNIPEDTPVSDDTPSSDDAVGSEAAAAAADEADADAEGFDLVEKEESDCF